MLDNSSIKTISSCLARNVESLKADIEVNVRTIKYYEDALLKNDIETNPED